MLEKSPNADISSKKLNCGSSPTRREAGNLVAGIGKFVSDIEISDVLHLAFVRSPIANANISVVDLDEAIAQEGVHSGFCGSHVAHLGRLSVNPILGKMEPVAYPVLANNFVCAVGQPVAAILADSPAQATDAGEMVFVDFEDDIQVRETTVNLKNSAAVFSKTFTQGNCAASFANAAHIVEIETDHPRLAPSPMENRAVAIKFDANTQCATIWLSTQTPHRARTELSKILAVDIELLHVIAPDVGGAFGLKASIYPEEVFAVWAAFELKRSVRWTANRSEDFLSASHGRGLKTKAKLAIDEDGKFLALEAEIVAPLGHWLTNSCAIPAWNAARILPGPYKIDSFDIETSGFKTHTSAVGIYRGAGRPEAAMLMERLVEDAARLLDLDPVYLRKINLLSADQMPHRRNTGVVIDSGEYSLALERLLDLSEYQQARANQQERRKNGEIVGIGVSFFVEPCGTGWESTSVSIHPDGNIIIRPGGSSQGHSRETAFAQIAADILGCSMDKITIICGDTKLCPEGIGALASRSTAIGGSAVVKAVKTALELSGGSLNPDKTIEYSCTYEADGEAWGNGCYLARVTIDVDTGQMSIEKLDCLDDAGFVVNPSMVEGQIHGGIAQGIGEAMMEKLVYDEDGQLLTGSLMDYALTRADDMPEINLAHMETLSPQNLLGAKGIGEAGTIGTPAAIYNAAIDALTPLGIKSIPLPLTSYHIWQAINLDQNKQSDEQ